MVVVVLNKICTFVKSMQFRRNPKLYFFTNKRSLTSSAITKVPLPVLDCVDRTDGATSHTNFYLMSTEKQFVTTSENAEVTSTQQNQNLVNNLIIEYVVNRLQFTHLFNTPIPKEYLAIYNKSLKTFTL